MTGVIDRRAALQGHLHYNPSFDQDDDDLDSMPVGYLDIAAASEDDATLRKTSVAVGGEFVFQSQGTKEEVDFEFTPGPQGRPPGDPSVKQRSQTPSKRNWGQYPRNKLGSPGRAESSTDNDLIRGSTCIKIAVAASCLMAIGAVVAVVVVFA